MTSIDKIYITHWEPLIERKQYLTKRLTELGLYDKVFFMTLYDRYTTDWNNIDKLYFQNQNIAYKMTKPQVCITLNHIECYKDILKNNYQNCLILEDDCLINIDDFQYQLDKILNSNVKDIYDFIFIGNYTIHSINNFKKVNDFLHFTQQSNTADAYLCSNKGIRTLLNNNIIPFSKVIDHAMNDWFKDFNLNVYMHNSPLIIQGSGVTYQSTNIDEELQ